MRKKANQLINFPGCFQSRADIINGHDQRCDGRENVSLVKTVLAHTPWEAEWGKGQPLQMEKRPV